MGFHFAAESLAEDMRVWCMSAESRLCIGLRRLGYEEMLTLIEGGTELLLVHSGFELFKNLAEHNSGWMFLCNKLGDLLKIPKK